MAKTPDEPTPENGAHVESQDVVTPFVVTGTGTPPTSPNFAVPRFSAADAADFPTQGNAITDTFDAAAAKRGAIVNADIAAGAAIVKTKLAALAIVDADVAAGAAIAEAKLALATDAAVGTGSRRTLGTGALQAMPGNSTKVPSFVQSAVPVLDVGVVGQVRAGRQLTAADFTALGLSVPLGLWNLSDLTDASGSGRALVNKGAVPFGAGINGAAATAAVFAGSTAQALYNVDTGGADPLRITGGSWGCWFRTAKRGVAQNVMGKYGATAGNAGYFLQVAASNNGLNVGYSTDGTAITNVTGLSDVADDRWHFGVATADGAILRCYVDGVLEATLSGPLMFGSSGALNIGAISADASTVASSPHYGRVDEAFVTADVLSPDQIRALYCVKLAHGLAVTPTGFALNVRRRRKGGPFATTDFPTQPLRLHNFTAGALTDQGSNNVPLTNLGGVGATGADGASFGAIFFTGGPLASTDAGLPAGTAARSYGCWFKAVYSGSASWVFLAWGTLPANRDCLFISTGGVGSLINVSGSDQIVGPAVGDGQWHFAVVVCDNAAGDGVRRKLYSDGALVAGSTVLASLTLAGANHFRVGADVDGTSPYTGQVDGAFVCGYALTQDQISTLYAKGSQAMAASSKGAGDHVEYADATNVYATFDTLDSQHQIDLAVTG